MVAGGDRYEELGKSGEGIKNYRLVVTEQSQGYSTGNIDNNVVIIVYSARWVFEISGDHFTL